MREKAGLESLDSLSPAGLALPQEKEMEKQRLLYQQARLHNRGAAEMVLQMISACKGVLHMHPAPPEHTHPVFTLPNPSVSCGPSVLCCHSPLHAYGLHTHPSPCMFHLPCDFSCILQSRSPLYTPSPASLTSPGRLFSGGWRILLPN